MIKFTTESIVKCNTCGEGSIRRTLEVSHGGNGSRHVSYDSHNACVKDDIAALERLDTFHERLLALQMECNRVEGKKLTSGWMTEFDFETVHPDACSERTLFVPTCTVRAYGLTLPLRLSPRILANQTADEIMAEMKKASEPVLIRLKHQRDSGDY